MAKKFTKLSIGDIVKTIGSRVFKKLTTEQPEDNTIVGTWLFNEYINVNGGAWYAVDFTSNGTTYIAMSDRRSQTSMIHDMSLKYFKSSTSYDTALGGDGSWRNEAYRTITINEEPTDEEFITWLKANATKQSASTPTLISFTIAGTTYQAEEGMTWKQWSSSTYNTSQYLWGDITNRMGYNDGMYQHYIQANGAFVLGDDVIINGFAYTDYRYAGGGAD